jgi:hypothetical protein
MDYPFCFQHPFPTVRRSVETVDISFEFSQTFSPVRWLSDDAALCADIFLQITTGGRELNEIHSPLAA